MIVIDSSSIQLYNSMIQYDVELHLDLNNLHRCLIKHGCVTIKQLDYINVNDRPCRVQECGKAMLIDGSTLGLCAT